MNKLRTFPTPTGVVIGATVDASSGAISIAVEGRVLACAGATKIGRRRAVTSDVSISLALGTSNRFFLVLADNKPFILDADAIPEKIVSSVSVSYLDDGEGLALF